MIYVRILSDFLFFFFALFVVSSTFSIAVAQLSLGVSLLLYLIILFLKKENPFAGQLKLFYSAIGLYIFWLFISSLFCETPIESLIILKEEWLFFAIPIGIYLFQKESFRKKIFISFVAAVCLVSIYGIVQHFTGIYWFKKTAPYEAFDFGYMVKGFFPHRLTFGNYFAVVSMFLLGYLVTSWKELKPAWRIILSINVALAVIVTLFSYSYGPILALIGTVIIYGFIAQRKQLIYILAIVICIAAVSLSVNPAMRERISNRIQKGVNIENEASRFYIWDNALTMIKQNPIFGVGQGNFYSQFEKNMQGHRIHTHAHNDFLHIAATAGIPGFIFFSAIWVILFRLIFIGLRKNLLISKYKNFMIGGLLGAIAFLITSLTEATFADEEVRQMLMLIWAFGLFPLLSKENKERNLSTTKE